MHITHIIDALPGFHERTGGAEQACHNLLRTFDGSDYKMTVITTTPTSSQQNFFKQVSIKTLENYFPSYFADYVLGIKNRIIPFDFLSRIQSKKIFDIIRPDLIQLYKFNSLSFSVMDSAIELNIPLILTVYDYWYFCPAGFFIDINGNICDREKKNCLKCNAYREFVPFFRRMIRLRNQFIERYIKKISRFVVLSDSSARILNECGIPENKITIIPQVLQSDVSEEPNVPSKIESGSIFFAGWMDFKKGLHVIIKAMPKIVERIPEVKLYVLFPGGSSEYQKKIYELINSLGLKEKIILIGKTPREKFLSKLRKTNCVIIPEQWENMSPVILMEAMALGKPVVASSIGGIPEFAQDKVTGFLVKRDSPDEFADKITTILSDKNLAVSMGRTARQRAATIYSPKLVFNRLAMLYEDISKKGHYEL
jgi:glycosyltransferase involved in cell wall biosynthesis